MVVIAVIALLLVATVCVNALITRRAGRADAIEQHERALDALRDLSEHPRPQPEFPHPDEPPTDHIRILEHRPQAARPPRTHTKRAAVSHRAGARPRIDVPVPPPATAEPVPAVLSFDDASPPSRPPGRPEPAYAVPPPPRPRRWWSGPSGRAALVAAAAAVTVVFVALVVATAVTPSHHADHSAAPARRAVEPPVTRAPVTAPPSTVALAPAQLLVSPTGNGTVTVRSPYALTLTTNGPCWVSIKDSTGRTVFEGTLQAGQRQEVPSAGPVDVRLGNTPVAQLTVNGTPLDLSKMSEVATLHFVAAA